LTRRILIVCFFPKQLLTQAKTNPRLKEEKCVSKAKPSVFSPVPDMKIWNMENAGATWVDAPACLDGNLVWGRVVADIPDYCRELIKALSD